MIPEAVAGEAVVGDPVPGEIPSFDAKPDSRASLPIGVFDSGVGGLTVVAALMRHLPNEGILYLGDTARLPYGDKSQRTVARYTRRNLDFLIGRGVKAAVIACNTASAIVLDELEVSLPIWGVVEPGAESALAATRGRVGVIATAATVRSDAYGRAIRRLDARVQVVSKACPLFVPLVEEGWNDDPISQQIAERYLEPLLAQDIDTLVLGCTHYPLLRPVLRRVVGPSVHLVDSAEAVSRRVARELAAQGLAAAETGKADVHFCVTDSGEHFTRSAKDLMQQSTADAAAEIDVSLELVEV